MTRSENKARRRKNKMLEVRVDEVMHNRLKNASKTLNKPISTLVRDCIEKYMGEEGKRN